MNVCFGFVFWQANYLNWVTVRLDQSQYKGGKMIVWLELGVEHGQRGGRRRNGEKLETSPLAAAKL